MSLLSLFHFELKIIFAAGFRTGKLRIDIGDSDEFTRHDIESLPAGLLESVSARWNNHSSTEQLPDNWLHRRKIVKVTNYSRVRYAKSCTVWVTEVRPASVLNEVPASMRWDAAGQTEIDLVPKTPGYAVLFEEFNGCGTRTTIFPQKPIVSLTLEETIELDVVAWAKGFRPAVATIRLCDLRSDWPTAQVVSRGRTGRLTRRW